MKEITIDNFFSISSLLKGSPEDFQIAISNLDKQILYRIMNT